MSAIAIKFRIGVEFCAILGVLRMPELQLPVFVAADGGVLDFQRAIPLRLEGKYSSAFVLRSTWFIVSRRLSQCNSLSRFGFERSFYLYNRITRQSCIFIRRKLTLVIELALGERW